MVISGYSTGILPFARQLPPAYLEPLKFSFDLALNAGNNVEFGLSNPSNVPLVSYKLKSGLFYDWSGRMVGTYQSGVNSIQYNYQTGISSQYLNGRLISIDAYPNYSGNPFERFYIKNNSPVAVDLDLTIRGFVPPAIYSPLTLNTSSSLSGEIIQSGLDAHPGQNALFQVYSITVPSGFGSVQYAQSGTGGLKYSITGGSYTSDLVIPVTFNTYWGQTIQNLVVGGSSTEDAAYSETGAFLTLYGQENLVYPGQFLDFFVDFYSNAAFPVTIELSGSGASTISPLSGTGNGFLTYQGNVFGSGTIFSDGTATGIADLFDADNLPYNTQYSVLDQYLNISNKFTEFYSKFTPFIGEYRVSYTGVELQGIYDGPNVPFIGRTWKGTGDVTVVYNFTESDNGIIVDAASYPGTGNPSQGNFRLMYGTNYIEYPYNPATYPTGEGYGYIENTITGQGLVTILEPVSFFGYGNGRIASGTTYVPATGTGYANYTGYVSDSIYYYDYQITYGDGPVYPDIEIEPEGIISGGAIIRVKNQNYIGASNYQGRNVLTTGVPDSDQYTWGYPTGPSYINVPGNSIEIVEYWEIPQASGLPFIPPSGDPIVMGYTGFVTGYVGGEDITVAGPVFPDPRDTGFYPYGGGNGLSAGPGVVYGRGCIFGSFSFSYASLGLALDGSIPITYNIESGPYRATVNAEYTDVNQQLSTPAQFFPEHFYKGGRLFFNDDLVNVRVQDQTFTGWAKISSSNITEVFALADGRDETDTLNDYATNGWINGERLVRPVPQIYSGGTGKFLRVTYLSNDSTSEDVASLRVSGAGIEATIQITGGGNGER